MLETLAFGDSGGEIALEGREGGVAEVGFVVVVEAVLKVEAGAAAGEGEEEEV